MKKKIIPVFLTALIVFLGITVQETFSQQPTVPRVLPLNNIREFSVLEAGRNAQFGIDQRPPGGGGPAYFISNAKVPNDIRYEIQFVLEESIDARPYNFLVFEMMGDTWEIMNDINEFYPRFRVDDIYVQFQGSFLFRGVIDRELNGARRQWVTISIPIAAFNIHAQRVNYNTVMSNTNIFLLRFIANRAPISGRIYFRNIRLQMEM
jgi:hypothetical protein